MLVKHYEIYIVSTVFWRKNMADISLTASMRSNLLSLQSTQSLMDMTQERLSTGKKVNSAIDNPSSYYTAQSLNNRASDLEALLDSMGQGIQTIKAANEAIETITSFAEQAKAIANSARDVASNFDKYAFTSKEVSEAVTGDIIIDARADMSTFTLDFSGNAANAEFDVYLGDGSKQSVTISGKGGAGEVAMEAVTLLQGFGLNAELDEAGTKITVSSTDGSDISWVNSSGANKMAKTVTGSASAVKITLDGTTGKNSATIAAAINNITTGAGNLAVAKADGKAFSAYSKSKDNEIRILGGAADTLEISGSKKAGDATAITQERIDYAKQFNEILTQIDNVAKDASYKGVNLLQENDLTVIFNEDRTSKIEVKGVDASSEGLGLAEAHNNWQKDTDIDASITKIEDAISKLRTMASDFGNNYSVVQTREEFTDNLINVLTEGADNLTLADMNEESANMLALQTRQQLAINSLSLASQASQAVLQLF